MKAVVAAFNQEKALVGAFSVITNLRMELFQALQTIQTAQYNKHYYTALRYPPLGPGANPWLHWHWKPPLVLVQVPLPHTAPVPHSSTSSHTRPVESRRKPLEEY